MAEPNRHYSISGFIGLLIAGLWHNWIGVVVGSVVAFVSHTPIDWLFSEFWDRTFKQTMILGVLGFVFITCSFISSWVFFSWWLALLMLVMALGQDIIDDVIMKNILHKPPIFPSHWGAPEYITVFGKRIRWYRDGWFKTETFFQTVFWACASSVLMCVLEYLMFLFMLHCFITSVKW